MSYQYINTTSDYKLIPSNWGDATVIYPGQKKPVPQIRVPGIVNLALKQYFPGGSDDVTLIFQSASAGGTEIDRVIAKAKVLGGIIDESLKELHQILYQLSWNEPLDFTVIKLNQQLYVASTAGFCNFTDATLETLAGRVKQMEIRGPIPVYFEVSPFTYFADKVLKINSPYMIGSYSFPRKALLGLGDRGKFTWPGHPKGCDICNFEDYPAMVLRGNLDGSQVEYVKGKTLLIQPTTFYDRRNPFPNLKRIDVENLIMVLDRRIRIPEGCTPKQFRSICMEKCFGKFKGLNKKDIHLKVLKSFPYDDLNVFYYERDTEDWCIPIEDLTAAQIEEARKILRFARYRRFSPDGAPLLYMGAKIKIGHKVFRFRPEVGYGVSYRQDDKEWRLIYDFPDWSEDDHQYKPRRWHYIGFSKPPRLTR